MPLRIRELSRRSPFNRERRDNGRARQSNRRSPGLSRTPTGVRERRTMSQPVKVIALLKARDGMTREEFARRWVGEHAPFTLRFPNLKGYRINIALDEYQEIEGELPYDGTAELWWDSWEEMQEDFGSDEAATAVADADTFTVVGTHIYTEEFVLR